MIFSNTPVRLQPYFGFRNERRLMVSARALKASSTDFKRSGRWRAIRTMIKQFTSHEMADLPVRLEIARPDGNTFSHESKTDKEGFVHFEVELEGSWPHGSSTDWETVALHWENESGRQSAPGHVLVPGQTASLGIISDIDDTILETGITGGLRNLLRNMKRVVAQLPEERIAVPGADVFYNALGGSAPASAQAVAPGDHLPATKRPFFYISSSPWNLYSYLVAFKRSRGLPLGPIMLRDWSLNRDTLGSASHGAHKREAIDRVLGAFPDMKFALIGDDTQGDFVAFGETVERHPNRIAAVFIRRAAKAELNADERAAQWVMKEASVPLWLGDDYSTGEAFLDKIGLASDGEAQQIIEIVK